MTETLLFLQAAKSIAIQKQQKERDMDIVKYKLLSQLKGLKEVYYGITNYRMFYLGHPVNLDYISFELGLLFFTRDGDPANPFSLHFDSVNKILGDKLIIEISGVDYV